MPTTPSSLGTGEKGGNDWPFFGGGGNIDNGEEGSSTPPINLKRILNGVDEKPRSKETSKRSMSFNNFFLRFYEDKHTEAKKDYISIDIFNFLYKLDIFWNVIELRSCSAFVLPLAQVVCCTCSIRLIRYKLYFSIMTDFIS